MVIIYDVQQIKSRNRGRFLMEMKNLKKSEEELAIPADEACNTAHVLRTIRLLEKGARQAFLDGDVTVDNTKAILDRVKEAKQHCKAGDVNTCLILQELVKGLTEGISETS